MKSKMMMMVAFVLGISAFAQAAKHSPTPAILEKGKTSFTTNCVTCHGEKGDGNGMAGALMKPKPRDFATDKFKNGDKPEQVFKSISEGVTGTAMVGFGHLPEEERWALTHYVLSFRKGKKK